jgi:hypothetical protein
LRLLIGIAAMLGKRKAWIINPTLPEPKPAAEISEERRLKQEQLRMKRNAYMRAYAAKQRALGKKFVPKDREKYNAYHREYERNKRAKIRAAKQAQITEHRNGITTQITELS